jgi:acetyl-CoA C-acetyltransferase
MKEVVITSAVRTAIDDFGGPLKDISCLELGKIVMLEAAKRSGVDKKDVDKIIMGNVLPGGLGQNPARQAMLIAGFPVETAALTINKVCGSGLKAIMLADQMLKTDDGDIIIAGGMENMYQAPYYLPKARGGYRLFSGELVDGMVHDGLWDIYNDFHMGFAAENVADRWNISREDQDKFALSSYRKAQKATKEAFFKDEIIPVEVPQRKGPPIVFDIDQVPQRDTNLEALGKLPAAFKKGGTVTAGNSSKITDGSSAVVVMPREKADALGIKPMARIIAHASAGIEVAVVEMAPIYSIPKVLKRAGMDLKDIELHEINEAFSVSTVGVVRELGIDESIVNVHGGAVALGHPIGCSGARIMTTLLYAMKRYDKEIGMASVCLGGGEAVSMIVQRLN